MKKFPSILTAALLAAGALGAADSGADFLLLEPAARAAGMGGADGASGGQLEALRYNPAGLSGLDNLDLAVSEMNAETDWNNSWAALGGKLGPVFVAGEAVVSNLTSFTLYNASGQAFATANVGSQNIGLGAAIPATSWLHVGTDVRYFHSQLYSYTSQGFALDAGMQVHRKEWPFSGGLAVQNMGSESAYISQSDPLPLLVRTSLQADFDLYQHCHVSPRVDVVAYQDSSRPKEVRLGVEATLYKSVFVRTGWIVAGDYEQACLGMGVQWQNLNLDYSYQPGNELGASEWVELRLSRP